ncbi:MAG: hypothetical protein HYV99_02495 [Betaproteobacteria bacterium]|nr:hypothetical protein [Betaproteobacteria bacterium]
MRLVPGCVYPAARARQRGQAFLIAVLLLVVGIGALIYSLVSPAKITLENDRKTADALARAKDALIGFAAGVDTSGAAARPGELLCPSRTTLADGTPTGIATTPCDTPSRRIGYLPWRTLGIPDLRDSSGERLWYAVSNNFKNNPRIYPLNSDTLGEYAVTGTTTASNVIAVVFAPGAVVGNQNRTPLVTALCATTGTTIPRVLCAENYLEGGNQDGDAVFTTGLPTATFNDKLLLITSDALFPAVEARVAKEVLNALNSYFLANDYFPPPAVPTDATCLGSGPLPATDCPSDPLPPAGTVHDTGRIPNLPLIAPYVPSSILNGNNAIVTCPGSIYWFQCNGWRELTWMAVSSLCLAGPTCLLGNLTVWWRPYGTSTANQKIAVFVAGRALTGDARSTVAEKTTPSNYIEAANVSGPNYDKGAATATFNDKVLHN